MVVFDKVFLFHEKTVKQMEMDRNYSNARAREKLGFIPTNTKVALDKTIADYYDHGVLKRYQYSPVLIMCLAFMLFCTILFYYLL